MSPARLPCSLLGGLLPHPPDPRGFCVILPSGHARTNTSTTCWLRPRVPKVARPAHRHCAKAVLPAEHVPRGLGKQGAWKRTEPEATRKETRWRRVPRGQGPAGATARGVSSDRGRPRRRTRPPGCGDGPRPPPSTLARPGARLAPRRLAAGRYLAGRPRALHSCPVPAEAARRPRGPPGPARGADGDTARVPSGSRARGQRAGPGGRGARPLRSARRINS